MKSFLLETIQEAGVLALDWFQRLEDLPIHNKSPRDIVSEADTAVEALIRERLTQSYPEFGFFGEESGTVEGSAGRWVVDPIDGTLSFTRGLRYWSISIAVEREGEPWSRRRLGRSRASAIRGACLGHTN